MYETFYKLSGKPFQLSPDPSFYYGSPVHRRAYAYLEYGLYQREGFIVITGEVGAGKTTLVRNLLTHLDPQRVVAAHLVSTNLDADDLVRAASVALGLRDLPQDKASMLAHLEKHLQRLAGERKQVLLIVDEAQNLTPKAVEELRMLSNFELSGRALLQSFLIGQPELRQTLRAPDMQQFRQRVIASYHLGALDETETRAYIEHRLRQVGWNDDPRLDDDAYLAIYALTAGIPRRINQVCNRLLLAGFLGERHRLTGEDVEMVARELTDELGVIGQPQGTMHGEEMQAGRAVSAAGAAAIRPVNTARRRLNASEWPAGATEDVGQRVARIERFLETSYRILTRYLRAIERSSPTEKRPR
jgi:putative secretion ATPase (PEP-CTERM system associated)